MDCTYPHIIKLNINGLKSNYKINIKELNIKQKQMCSSFILDYLKRIMVKNTLGVIKFNLFCILTKKELVSLEVFD